MAQLKKCALIGLLTWGAAALAAEQSFNDRLEMLDWSDPERAVTIVDDQSLAKGRASEIQFLEIRGMVLVDVRRDADADATMARLKEMADVGDQSAAVAGQTGPVDPQ